MPLDSQSQAKLLLNHKITFAYLQTSLPEAWYSLSCQQHDPGHQRLRRPQKGQPESPVMLQLRGSPAQRFQDPRYRSRSVPSVFSKSRSLKLTVSQGKTCRHLHCRFGATARTCLLTHVSAHASGKSFSFCIPWLPCLQKQGL